MSQGYLWAQQQAALVHSGRARASLLVAEHLSSEVEGDGERKSEML